MTGAYYDSFSYEWSHWPSVQLDSTTSQESEQTFRLKTGLTPADVRGKVVLDVGCGAGRFLEVVSRWGAAEVIGIDPSSSCEVARRNLHARDNVGVAQCGLFEVEEASNGHQWDIVYCIGVLHHTPDPAGAFQAIAQLVKPGGLLCVWVYWSEMGRWTVLTDLYRRVTTRLPWWLLRLLCLLAVPWAYVYKIPKVGPWIWLVFPSSMHPKWRARWLDNFDFFSPIYQHKHTFEEVVTWFVREGFQDIRLLNFPVSVRGRKPPHGAEE